MGDLLAERATEALLVRIASTLRQLVPCDDIAVWELDRNGSGSGDLVAVLVEGDDADELLTLRIPLGHGITGAAAASGRPVVASDALTDPRAAVVPGTSVKQEAIAAMPLTARGSLLGALSVYRAGAGRAFGDDEVELISHFAEVAALALDNARAHSELQLLAGTDDLTGLANRRRFRAELARELAAARRERQPLSLLLFDLDGFKHVNDAYGHDQGDDVLQRFAAILTSRTRASDLVGRLGGDEFALLLPNTSLSEAEQLARLLAEEVRESLHENLTVSVGTASTTGACDPEDLLRVADRRLYETKSVTARTG